MCRIDHAILFLILGKSPWRNVIRFSLLINAANKQVKGPQSYMLRCRGTFFFALVHWLRTKG